MATKISRKKMLKMMGDEIKQMRSAIEDRESGKVDEERNSEYYREPLSIETSHEVEILLSWGGPSDGFKLYFDNDWEFEEKKCTYFFSDWGTYEEIELSSDDAQLVYEVYLLGDVKSTMGVE